MDFLTVIKTALIQIVSGAVRTLLVSGLSWLAARNLVDASTSSQLEAWIPIAIAAILWSVIEKYIITRFHLEQVIAALALPENSSPARLKESMAEQKVKRQIKPVSEDWTPPKGNDI